MTLFHLDYETRSTVDLAVRGLHNYATDPTTEVILAAYAEGDHKPKLWQPHLGPLPAELREALEDPWVTVAAWNAAFERAITKFALGIDKPSAEFYDPMAGARYMSLPGYLDEAGRILGVGQQKMEEGSRLVKKFCEPAVEGGKQTLFGISKPAYRDWVTDPEDWDLFCQYNIQDVVAERAVMKKLSRFPLPEKEQRTWVLDQTINERGVPTDMPLVNGAAWMAAQEMTALTARLHELTQLENPNSRDQFLGWIRTQEYAFSGLGKAFVARAMAGECDLTDIGREALEIRKLTSKTSVHKYSRIADTVSPDGRLRHQFAFMGAARTGRWSGRGAGETDDAGGVQLQNLSRPTKAVEKKMDLAINLVRKMDIDGVRKEFGNVLDVVSSTVRAAFMAPPGFRFVVCDLNAVENRGLGYLARCDSILKVFRTNFEYTGDLELPEGVHRVSPMDPYLDFGTHLYGQTYEDMWVEWKIQKNATKRTNSKAPTLGCGYRLSGGEEIITEEGDRVWTGLLGYARNMGIVLSKEETDRAVKIFRKIYPEVVQLWYDTESASIRAVKNPGQTFGVGTPTNEWERGKCLARGLDPDAPPRISFRCTGESVLEMILPSGRSLHYLRPQVETQTVKTQHNEYEKEVLSFEGLNQKTKQWGRIDTHGGKWVENADQAICRDVLAEGMHRAEAAGFEICAHVHDEIVSLVPEDSPLGPEELSACMSAPMPWAGDDLPLGAEGWTGVSYRKN